MCTPLSTRILKEIEKASKSKEFAFYFDSEGKYGDVNMAYLHFQVPSGIYKGQRHILRIQFTYGQPPDVYSFPQNPPNVVFLTAIYHPNISRTGLICVDILKTESWSPMYGLMQIFQSILLLLETPNPESPFNIDANKTFLRLSEKKDDTYIVNMPEFKKLCDLYYEANNKKEENIQNLFTYFS